MAKSQESAQGPSRLPSTKESRPALIGLALLLIVGGALASGYLALTAGNRAEFVQVANEITQGQEITEDDLTTVSLPEGYDGAVPASDMDSLVGQSTTVRLLAGTIVTPDMVSDKGGIPEGKSIVPVVAQQSIADTLSPGSQVIVTVVGDEGSTVKVPGEVTSIPEVTEDNFSSSAGEIPLNVQVDVVCADEVLAGKQDDAVEIAIGVSDSEPECE